MPNVSASRLHGGVLPAGASRVFLADALRVEITRILVADTRDGDQADSVAVYHVPRGENRGNGHLILRLAGDSDDSAQTDGSGITLGPGDALWMAPTEADVLVATVYGVAQPTA